jgi:predicted LPLAT superfamily acyltransferase
MYAGKTFPVHVEGLQHFQRLSRLPAPFVQLSSHVGNYEMVGYSLVSPKPINALVFAGETATVMQNRAQLFGATNVRMVPVSEDLSHIFSLNNALADGEIASLPGDRVFGSKKTVQCRFFGEPAPFPAGPFTLAVQREAPVLLVFVMKEGRRRYKVLLERLPDPEGATRQERVQFLADAYAAALEAVVRQYPDQWYNFYDFWK